MTNEELDEARAFREWESAQWPAYTCTEAAYLAGARMATERERERVKAGDLLAWLEQHPELELSWGDVGDVSECNWRVHARHGGVNDREWRLVDVGRTPTEALRNARVLLKEDDQ